MPNQKGGAVVNISTYHLILFALLDVIVALIGLLLVQQMKAQAAPVLAQAPERLDRVTREQQLLHFVEQA